MHLYRFSGSLFRRVCSTRSSILAASRYFWMERIIFRATCSCRTMSKALTTLPNVPWPRSLSTRSRKNTRQICSACSFGRALTLSSDTLLGDDDKVPVLIVDRGGSGVALVLRTVREWSFLYLLWIIGNIHREQLGYWRSLPFERDHGAVCSRRTLVS